MVLLQNRLNLKVSQKQILTPGLVQMVSVLALNKLELKDMITAEMVENPVLEELDPIGMSLEENTAKEEKQDRVESEPEEKTDPFDEIDFGSFFRDYLDPGHRTHEAIESIERPAFENFLSTPATLTDHLAWQLGALHLSPPVREAAELVIGNLNEDGYLTASNDELLGLAEAQPEEVVEEPEEEPSLDALDEADLGMTAIEFGAELSEVAIEAPAPAKPGEHAPDLDNEAPRLQAEQAGVAARMSDPARLHLIAHNREPLQRSEAHPPRPQLVVAIQPEHLQEGIRVVQAMDPIGVAARDLRECILLQLEHQKRQYEIGEFDGVGDDFEELIAQCIAIGQTQLKALQNKNFKEIAKAIGKPVESVMKAIDYIRTLDPKPGSRYNQSDAKLIEPDCAFIKHAEDWLVLMNEDDLPQLRLSPTYRKLLQKDAAEKDVRNYVKERYKSAIQLIKNIEQRKQTILKVCYSIIERQKDFLENGIDRLRPMMIKEVAEEIGVHPSTVSRAVANKYCHTPQGVFELRYFFSESVNGPEGGGTPLLVLKRRVKQLIEEEDPKRPLTDEKITRVLQSQGIQVTRRTVAKYREDMRIPSTHQRRQKD